MRTIAPDSPKLKAAKIIPAPASAVATVETPPATELAPVTKAADPMVELLKDFPAMLASAIAKIPAPVISPRPPGAWVVDVQRDRYGQMQQMTAKFHEIK